MMPDTKRLSSPPAAWYAEPLLHFLLLGLALFALNAWWEQRTAGQGNIVISEAQVHVLAQNFRRTWQRPPTPAELEGLIEEHIRDEVLTREAQRLGLDRDDAVIRRRLRQKIEIITEEAAGALSPTDAQLEEYFRSNASVFRSESRVAFAQVYFDPAKRGQRIDADVNSLLESLRHQSRKPQPAQLQKMGDRLFSLKPRYELTSERDISSAFGSDFAKSLLTQTVGEWSGPVLSGYGLHLVYIEDVVGANPPAFSEVRPLVEREWRNVQRKQVAEAQYRQLLAGYKIRRPESRTFSPPSRGVQ